MKKIESYDWGTYRLLEAQLQKDPKGSWSLAERLDLRMLLRSPDTKDMAHLWGNHHEITR